MSRAFRITALCSTISLLMVGHAIGNPQSPHSLQATAARTATANPQPAGGMVILFNQTANPGTTGLAAMKNLDVGSENFDTALADDFAVPVGGWAVSQVRVGVFYQSGSTPVTPSTAGNITIHVNAAGAPGAAVAGCAYADIPLSHDSTSSFSTLNLPTECVLPTGTYWVSFSGNLSFAAEFGGVFVLQQTVTSTLAPHWRNAGNGFGTGCTNWTALPACNYTSAGGMTVQLLGRTTPVTLQAFGVD